MDVPMAPEGDSRGQGLTTGLGLRVQWPVIPGIAPASLTRSRPPAFQKQAPLLDPAFYQVWPGAAGSYFFSLKRTL